MLLAGGLSGGGALVPDAANVFFYFSHNPLLAWETSGQGHNDAVLICCLLGFILAARADRPQLAVCLLTAAALLKAAALPVLALYLLFVARRSWPKALWLALLSAIVAALIFAPIWEGLSTLRGTFLQLGGDPTRHTRSFVDMFCYPARLFGGPALEALLFKVGLVITSAALLLVFLRSSLRLREVKDVFHGSLVVLFASCLLTPWSQPWYATWLLPFAMIDEARPWRDAIALYAVLSLVQYGAPADPYTYLAVNTLPLYVLLRRAPGAVPRLKDHSA
jgi:hypothetical protein